MATKRDPKVVMAPAYQAERRRMRRPSHRFSLKTLPYQLQPFFIAPVLPGETMQNLLLQARVVSDPVSPVLKLTGAWKEYYVFYVRLRDLREDIRDDMANMILDPGFNPAPLQTAANAKYYHYANGINYTLECTRRIVEEYFRDEGEDWDDYLIDGMPAAKLYGRGQNDWADSLTKEANYADLGVAIPEDGTVEGLDYAYQSWTMMRDAGLMTMDFEDFCRQYGVQVREEETSPNLHRPELIRHWRQWTYPTNIVEPSNGIPSTAYAWSVAQRADRRMFFDEPGFLVGLTTMRLKLYLGNQEGAIAHSIDNVQNWLPAVIHARSDVSHKFFAEETGPLAATFGDTAGGYWIDLRDLMSYGDQFINYTLDPENQPGIVQLPLVNGNRRYLATEEVQSWFLADVEDGADYEQIVREDGVIALGILGRQSPKPGQLVLGSGMQAPALP